MCENRNRSGTFSSWKGYLVGVRSVRRDYWNHDNGPFNVDLDDDLSNRKLIRKFLINPNDIVGVRLSSSGWSGFYGVEMAHEILQKSYDLVKWIYPTVNKFPKSQRLILSQRIELLALSILSSAIKLVYLDGKATRKNTIMEIHKLQILLRISKDLSFLSFKQYEYASKILTEMLKILTEMGGTNENIQQFIR